MLLLMIWSLLRLLLLLMMLLPLLLLEGAWAAHTSVKPRAGHFSGINRKVQFKPSAWTNPVMVAALGDDTVPALTMDTRRLPRLRATVSKRAVKASDPLSPVSTPALVADRAAGGAAALPPTMFPFEEEVTELVVVVKWGGVLTHAGREQAVRVATCAAPPARRRRRDAHSAVHAHAWLRRRRWASSSARCSTRASRTGCSASTRRTGTT